MTVDLIALLGDVEWGHMGGGWWIVMLVGMAAVWALAIGAVVWLVRGGSADLGPRRTEGPLEILDRRLAEGTITADEYRERREILHGPAR